MLECACGIQAVTEGYDDRSRRLGGDMMDDTVIILVQPAIAHASRGRRWNKDPFRKSSLLNPPVDISCALHSLLQAAFKVPQHVVGLMDRAGTSGSEQENGVVVPLSLACRTPQVL